MVTPVKQYEVGQFYHVFNRGNRKQPIFYRAKDFQRFLDHFQTYREDHSVTVLAYALMDNHYHFLVRQDAAGAITKLFGRLATSHAKYFNKRYEQVGSLFQRSFHANRITEESHFLHLSRYIHRNVVDLLGSTRRVEPSELIDEMLKYPWSSLREYLDPASAIQSICDVPLSLEMSGLRSSEAYRTFLQADIENFQSIEKYSLDTTRRVKSRESMRAD